MTSTVPPAVAWPLILFMAIVVVSRYVWFNTSLYDTYLNNTLAILLTAQLLREHVVQQLLSDAALITVTTAQQLAAVVLVFGSTEFIGFTMMWSGLSGPDIRRRHRYYRCAAILLVIGYLVAAARARIAAEPVEVCGGWDGVLAYCFYSTMFLVLVVQLMRLSIRELTRRGAPRRERLIAACGVALALAIGWVTLESLLLLVFEQLGWLHTGAYRVKVHGVYFFWEAVGCTALAAVPCLLAIIARGGLDPVSRQWRKLQPLRNSLRQAAPESSFDLQQDGVRRRKTTLQLHQTVVEIRDLILQLRPYARDVSSHQVDEFVAAHSIPSTDRDTATLALQLAHAADAKASGLAAQRIDATHIVTSRATTLEQETRELVQLAKWWPAAASAITAATVRRDRRGRAAVAGRSPESR
ncbi:DUF6545 domain-containing protein [Mycobacterium stomatepiae]|uniref:DUF6545 domain-containing protein n=1 Tax=Mycobacterium stomatepiae TaxID=470076 RepID=A0A7I7Q7N8_9MYCO|nr:DUF6545 domain-containing protein [Mycobacterium stomatepiae]MCV7163181.1 hypothetical protein [Mycobacterium stomatepiae]BBY22047.1 hypothetical protein MSTO_22520 [Mycobacterium stomatepiae]